MRVLITGANGQVGRALMRSSPPGVHATALARSDLDITDGRAVRRLVDELEPDAILNAAAYTAVDQAESDPQAAHSVNAEGARWLAEAVSRLPACRLVHISTDFVFDGTSSRPYSATANSAPINVYGESKLAGERAIMRIVPERAVVLRTAWVYDSTGRNFMNTMLRLMRAAAPLRVVADQIGTPTAASSVADVIWKLVARPDLNGLWHWSDAGVASWYDFAVAIAEEGQALGLLQRVPEIQPVSTEEFPTAAKRPAFSVLDKRSTIAALSVRASHWRNNLRHVMKEIPVA